MVPTNTTPSEIVTPSGSDAVGRLALRFGVGVGVLCSFWLLFLQLTGNNPFSPKQILGLLLVPFAAAGSQWFLRRELAPARPGVGRSLAVGGLTVLIAAVIATSSVYGLAYGVGEEALTRSRAELLEITRVQQQLRPKEKRDKQFEQQEIKSAASLSISDLARGTFTWVILLGMIGAVPSGIFLRK